MRLPPSRRTIEFRSKANHLEDVMGASFNNLPTSPLDSIQNAAQFGVWGVAEDHTA